MKNKKGFTLIELIVVIAIIGVLAAILVPMIAGYIKKSKITSADNSAELVMKAANSALVALSEADCSFSGDQTFHHLDGAAFTDPVTPSPNDADSLYSYMALYFDEVKNTEFAVYIHDGVCVASAAKSGVYYGTSPKVYSSHDYGRNGNAPTDAGDALDDAVDKYNEVHSGDNDSNANPGT